MKRIRGPLAALSLLFSISSASAAPNSWVNRPAWANDDETISSSPKGRSKSSSARAAPEQPFAPGSHNLSLDLGQVFLMGDLGDRYAGSIGFRGTYAYGVSDLFAFQSSIGYSDHSSGAFSMTNLLAGMRMNLSWYDKVVPYLNFGLGFYRPSYTFGTRTAGSGAFQADAQSLSPVLFGVHLGPGVSLEVTRSIFFGASLTFHQMFGDQRTLANGTLVSVGGTFTSFMLNAGMSL